jgi:phosphoglycolate phosphatase
MLEVLMDRLGARPERTLMVGDTTHDLQMAANARVGAIALTCGAHAADDLRSLAPLACLADFRGFLQWLRRRH